MSRIIKEFEIEGKKAIALLDTGSFHTYIRSKFVADILEPYKVALGGRVIEVKKGCIINGKIEGLGFDTKSVPIEEIGKAEQVYGFVSLQNFFI